MTKIATLVGCAIGDALGNPFEMKSAISPALQQWDGKFKAGGTFWRGEAGQYTDDTLMSIALATSLVEKQGFDGEDVAKKYLAWMESGNTRGIGGTTSQSLTRLKFGATWKESGLTGNKIGGNGTAMRASPIGLVYYKDWSEVIRVAVQDASITHNAMEPQLGSVAVATSVAAIVSESWDSSTDLVKAVEKAISDISLSSVVKTKLQLVVSHLEKGTEPILALAEIGSAGYVPETVGAALYCFGSTNNFKDCVVMAVRAGGDTDTTAAIAGAIAGTYYGLEGIPQEYKDGVENFQLLQDLTDELLNIQVGHESKDNS